jgi:DHA2 family multidrug resistance protein
VNVALPTMMGNLGATLEDISMVVTGYAIANAIVLPVSAWMGERIGRRKYYLSCIVAFTLTSVACGLAPNLLCLTIFRILQGLAGGALLPTSQTLIYEQFPKEKAGMAGAVFGMSVMVGPALGPVLGGYLTDQFGWRSIFNVNLPLGLLALLVGLAVIFDPDYQVEAQKGPKAPLDTVGLTLLVLGIGCMQYVFERGEADDWFSSNGIIGCAAMALFCLPSFVVWELKEKHPIINVRLFKDGIVLGGVTLMAAVGFFLYGVVFLMPTFLSRMYHYDATQIGALFIPGSLVTMAMMPVVGKLMQGGVNPKILVAWGFIIIEATLFLMTRFSPLSDKVQILHMLYCRGLAMAFLFVPINSTILSQFKGSTMGQVSGLLNLFRQIGGSISIAMVATLLNSRSHQNYLDLAGKVTLLNPNVQGWYAATSNGMNAKMQTDIGLAYGPQIALKAMWFKLQNQVFMMSFLQLVFIMMIAVSFSFVPLYFMKIRKTVKTVADAH